MPDNVIATVGNNKVLSETIVNFSQLPLRRWTPPRRWPTGST